MNNHNLISKYTKLIMKRLYNQEVQVFFYDMKKKYRALFREKGLQPYSFEAEEWDKNNCNITFHCKIFSKSEELPPHTWNTIIHEVTHYKIGIEQGKRDLRHPPEFYNLYKKNYRQVKDLYKDFLEEYEKAR